MKRDANGMAIVAKGQILAARLNEPERRINEHAELADQTKLLD
jgi:hypothetical protein